MGLLDALDESIANVEAEKGSPTRATLASTSAKPPASCGTYELVDTKTYPVGEGVAEDMYLCAANGFYLYKRSPTSWCVGKAAGAKNCKCYQSKKGWQNYENKQWMMRADVSLTFSGDAPAPPVADRVPTFDDLRRRAAALPPRFTVEPAALPSVGDVSDGSDDGQVFARPPVPQRPPQDAKGSDVAGGVPPPQQTAARVQGGMMADDDDDDASSSSDDEEVEVQAPWRAVRAPEPKAPAPAKPPASDAFGLAYKPYDVYGAATARDAGSAPARAQTAPDSSNDEFALDASAPAPAKTDAPARPGAKAPPPAHVAQDARPPAEAKAPPPVARDAPAARSPPRDDTGAFQAFDPAVLAKTVAAYRAPIKVAPEPTDDAWAGLDEAPAAVEEAPVASEPITYDEAFKYFQSLDLSSDHAKINPTQKDQRNLLKQLFKRRPALKASVEERDLPFLLALQRYDPRVPVHWRMVHTIFRELTPKNRPVPCPTLGSHWVLIGFQGNDPRTDVNRAMRCLALLQLLHLLEFEKRLAGACFRSANQGGRDWPFACTSISFTLQALQALRKGKLYARCNALGGVLPALHEHHAALFRDFLGRIKSGQDRFCALNDVRDGKKPVRAAQKAPVAVSAPPVAAFASLGGLPDDGPAAAAAGDASLGRRYLVA